jgi:signal transduction histidine kinase
MWQHTPLAYPTVGAALVSGLLAGYCFRYGRREGWTPVVTVFLAVNVGLLIWAGVAALKLLATDPAVKLAAYRLLYFGVSPLGALALLFALVYTDREGWITAPRVALLLAAPVTFWVLLFTNPADLAVESTRLVETGGVLVMRVDVGPAHWLLQYGYNATLSLAAVGIVGAEAVRLGRSYLPQAILAGVGIAAPLVFVLLSAVGAGPFDPDGVNLIPTAAAVTSTALGVAVFRYRLLDLPPIAYTTAIDESPDGVLVADPETRIVHANETGRRVLARRGGAVGGSIGAPFPEVDLSTPEPDTVRVDADGSPSFFSVRTRPLSRRGTRLGWVVVLRDVTDLQRQQRALEAKNERLEEFAGVVSHDLRNPLNVASARVALAQSEHDSDHLATAARAHERMEALITDLLALARDGETVDRIESVTLGELLSACWQTVETGDATLSTRTDRTIMADPDRLRRLFENLLRNAVEHGDRDVTITVGDTEGGFYVADDGPGIPAETRGRIFESGFSTAADGTGFGLSIVERIVDAHGWEIDVAESDDGGARFEISGVESG